MTPVPQTIRSVCGRTWERKSSGARPPRLRKSRGGQRARSRRMLHHGWTMGSTNRFRSVLAFIAMIAAVARISYPNLSGATYSNNAELRLWPSGVYSLHNGVRREIWQPLSVCSDNASKQSVRRWSFASCRQRPSTFFAIDGLLLIDCGGMAPTWPNSGNRRSSTAGTWFTDR